MKRFAFLTFCLALLAMFFAMSTITEAHAATTVTTHTVHHTSFSCRTSQSWVGNQEQGIKYCFDPDGTYDGSFTSIDFLAAGNNYLYVVDTHGNPYALCPGGTFPISPAVSIEAVITSIDEPAYFSCS